MMKKLALPLFFLVLASIPYVNAADTGTAADSLVAIETERGYRSGILVKIDDGVFVLTSQDVFKDSFVSMKTISGKSLQPLSYEAVSDEQNGTLRIKTDSNSAVASIEDANLKDEEVTVFRTDPSFGIMSAVKAGMQKGSLKLPPPGKDKPAPSYLRDIVGSPVLNKKGNIVGIVGLKGASLPSTKTFTVKSETLALKNVVHPVKTMLPWTKVDSKAMMNQISMLNEAEEFLQDYLKVADLWCQSPYKPIDMTPEQPEKMKAWIQARNESIKDIPALSQKIKDGTGKMGDSMKNVCASQLREQTKPYGRRLCDFCPFYQRNLDSIASKGETPYLKKAASEISPVYKTVYDEVCRQFEEEMEKRLPAL